MRVIPVARSWSPEYVRLRLSQPIEPGRSGWPSAVAHQPGGMWAEAVRAAGRDGLVAQAARAPTLRTPMISERIMARQV